MNSQVTTRRIEQLSSSVINKIAAGEVIERPASVVKELLENAVDAGASQIELAIEQGGVELIRVTDNGKGIPQDQLELAVTSHATSKIVDADDLFQVGTFGFRGEALASIAEVSQMRIASRAAGLDCGFELEIVGGRRDPIQPVGLPQGTTVEVRQLFFNTPVRQKFLRTPGTEKGHITEAFTRVALGHPEIQMTLRHNGKVQHQLPACDNWRDRIDAFFGPEISQNLIPVDNHNGTIGIRGFVVDPSVSRANNRMQYLFLNGRYIRDRSLQHALSESYRGLLMVGRFPICFLRLEMPFEMVDVNVHPAKLEVRFQNGGQIYSQLLGAVRHQFLTTDLTSRAQLSRRTDTPQAPLPPPDKQTEIGFAASPPTPAFDWTQAPRQPLADQPTAGHPSETTTAPASWPSDTNDRAASQELPAAPAEGQPAKTPTALQVYNTYLITEEESGMLVIDQHALHERVIYEQIREKVLRGTLESQRMLVPEPVALPPAEAGLVLQHAELLAKVGVGVEPFGGDTVLVTAYPAMLANHNPAEMLRGIVDQLMAGKQKLDQRDLIDELLHMISCKAAVKAGDPLTTQEITALLQHRELCQDSHHCPHGRPTALVFSRAELDRRFKRV